MPFSPAQIEPTFFAWTRSSRNTRSPLSWAYTKSCTTSTAVVHTMPGDHRRFLSESHHHPHPHNPHRCHLLVRSCFHRPYFYFYQAGYRLADGTSRANFLKQSYGKDRGANTKPHINTTANTYIWGGVARQTSN